MKGWRENYPQTLLDFQNSSHLVTLISYKLRKGYKTKKSEGFPSQESQGSYHVFVFVDDVSQFQLVDELKCSRASRDVGLGSRVLLVFHRTWSPTFSEAFLHFTESKVLLK